MANPLVLYEVKDNIAYITLNRPEKRNALNGALQDELAKALEKFEQDAEALVAILSGAGKAFCSGADVSSEFGASAPVNRSREPLSSWNGVKIMKPIIGAVQGYAIGAGYALAVKVCDITIAAESARFADTETKLGQSGLGSPYYPYMPFKVSLEFFLTGGYMSAARAYEVGLVNKVVPDADLMTEAKKMAELIKKNAPLSMKSLKYRHYGILDDSFGRSGRAVWEYENFTKPIRESEDIKEGPRAFSEKRPPKFKGK